MTENPDRLQERLDELTEDARRAAAAAGSDDDVPSPDPELEALFASFVSRAPAEHRRPIVSRRRWSEPATMTSGFGPFKRTRTLGWSIDQHEDTHVTDGWMATTYKFVVETETYSRGPLYGYVGLAVDKTAQPWVVVQPKEDMSGPLFISGYAPGGRVRRLGSPTGPTMRLALYRMLGLGESDLPGHGTSTLHFTAAPPTTIATGDPEKLMPGYIAEALARALMRMTSTS